ncbi:aldolase [Devosia algicola]|uniref:Aldolase n=1 Tax=Devosia algicola TaxID=3026418 RepID=A0ABY7YLB1_9HYPH|nr:aldolase [Devosia algicola]WDR02090.1 aldolase [Devosia algicola]
MNTPNNVHGTGLMLGQTGILLRGPSGTGKSVLALALLERWEMMGKTALLVSDDQVLLSAAHGHLQMHAPETIAGSIELRGRGIVARPALSDAPLHLVIDLVETLDRMPPEEAFAVELLGVGVARAPVPRAGVIELSHQTLLVVEAIRALAPRPAKL